MLFTLSDFRKKGVVKTEAPPSADVGHKQCRHAPLQVLGVKPEQPDAPCGPDVAEAFEKEQFAAQIIGHAAQKRGGHNDDEKRGGDDVAVQLGVDEGLAQKINHIGFNAIALGSRNGGVEKGENGRCDDEEVGGVCPVIHEPTFLNRLFGIGFAQALRISHMGNIGPRAVVKIHS